jgi:hypothetical protein
MSAEQQIPVWWKEWFSPATVLLFFTAIGTIVSVTWATSSRLTVIEIEAISMKQRQAAVEGTLVTKEWLTREIQYQQQSSATKASVDVIGQRLEEFQRQLNDIQTTIRTLADRPVRR